MKLSARTKTNLAVATALSLVGAGAWAQNLEVKGRAWFGTGGDGAIGIGKEFAPSAAGAYRTPTGMLHVIGSGGFGAENADGTHPPTTIPLIVQANQTAFAMLNASGRPVFAVNVWGGDGTNAHRGYPVFFDKADGGDAWRSSLFLARGNVGIGTVPNGVRDLSTDAYGRVHRLDVAGDVRVLGPLWAAGSDLYFSNTAHQHTGWGNAPGHAAIENATNYGTDQGYTGTLMILGRMNNAGTGRRVDVWDFLNVNGHVSAASMDVRGNHTVAGDLTVYRNFTVRGSQTVNGGQTLSGNQAVLGSLGVGKTNPAWKLDVETGTNQGDIAVGGLNVIRRDGYGAHLFAWGTGYAANKTVRVGELAETNLSVNGRISAVGDVAVYVPNPKCGAGKSLTLERQCSACTSMTCTQWQCDNSGQESERCYYVNVCCGYAMVDNVPAGRLLAP